MIDRLMKRDEFADYWSVKWCDLLRVKAEFPINLWPNAAQAYHRWVRASIVENKPYDQMVYELLTATGNPGQIPSDLFEHKSEADLYSAYQKVKKSVSDAMQKGLFEKALQDIATLRGSVDAFFDGVMVLAEDKSIRRNRLALLEHIAALFGQIADFSKLST